MTSILAKNYTIFVSVRLRPYLKPSKCEYSCIQTFLASKEGSWAFSDSLDSQANAETVKEEKQLQPTANMNADEEDILADEEPSPAGLNQIFEPRPTRNSGKSWIR